VAAGGRDARLRPGARYAQGKKTRFIMYRYTLLSLSMLSIVGCQSTGNGNGNGAGSGAGNGAPTTAPVAVAPAALSGSSATLIVHGMGCPMCANNIDRQLLRVPGVQKVDVDLGTGQVALTFAPDRHPSRNQIVRAVEESGFTLREFRQP
jgi:copper chaperone CopZ